MKITRAWKHWRWEHFLSVDGYYLIVFEFDNKYWSIARPEVIANPIGRKEVEAHALRRGANGEIIRGKKNFSELCVIDWLEVPEYVEND